VPDTVWLFDLDNTLHNASASSFPGIDERMTEYIARELQLAPADAALLRAGYLLRYGATLLGLVRHHGVKAPDFDALDRLPGRKIVLTNAPRAYAERVLGALGAARHFDGLISIEDMAMFGDLRPKPDARMLRWVAARLKVHPSRCVLVEDTLQHQKAAFGIGMRTVWMQRWTSLAQRRAKHVTPGRKVGVYLHRKPTYVCARIFSLQALRRLPTPR
jgi:putative hydrolase of the HAD superfamily